MIISDFLTTYYTDHEPESCFLLEVHGAISGYLLGSRKPLQNQLYALYQNVWLFFRALTRYFRYNQRSRRFIRWILMYGWREVPAQPRRKPHFHINLLPEARKVSTTRALMSAYLSYLYRSGEKRVCGQIITFESRRGEKMFERYGFKVLNRAEITKYKALYPESVYLSTVIKNLETADPLSAYRAHASNAKSPEQISGCSPGSGGEQRKSSILGKRSTQSEPANYAGVRKGLVLEEANAHSIVERCVVDCGRCEGVQSAVASGALDFRSGHRRHCRMVIIFVIVAGIIVYALMRFPRWREGERDPDRPGNKTVEIVWTAIPLPLSRIFSCSRRARWACPTPPPPPEPDLVVTGHQWWWEARYPKSGVVVANEFHIPVGKPVSLRLESSDVLHEFWVPELARKITAVPGHPNHIWFKPTSPGRISASARNSAEPSTPGCIFCIVAEPQADFEDWEQAQLQPAAQPAERRSRRKVSRFSSRRAA